MPAARGPEILCPWKILASSTVGAGKRELVRVTRMRSPERLARRKQTLAPMSATPAKRAAGLSFRATETRFPPATTKAAVAAREAARAAIRGQSPEPGPVLEIAMKKDPKPRPATRP